MKITLDQFVRNLADSGLMSADRVRALWRSIPENKRPSDAETFGRILVKNKKLTAYQCQAVLRGDTKGLLFGDYVVLEELGRGGMGMVLKARDERMDRDVAIKRLHDEALDSEEAVQRFFREGRAAARLLHPNIVAAFHAAEQRGIHYLVMEYVEGRDLASVVKEEGPLSVARAVDYVIQAASGLEYAHGEGIVHRDVKPSNLLLDTRGRIKILDMGLAQLKTEFFSQWEPSHGPQHPVRITKPFFLGQFEVTVCEFRSFAEATNFRSEIERTGRMGSAVGRKAGVLGDDKINWREPGYSQSDRFPVEVVTADDAERFCRWLTQTTGGIYRLPSEAEWEYACRAGTTTRYYPGDDMLLVRQYAWLEDESEYGPHPVGQKKPNAWNLYDMHGNAWEWCADYYAKNTYAVSPVDDPRGPSEGELRVVRGGGWNMSAPIARSTQRWGMKPSAAWNNLGFRVVREVNVPQTTRHRMESSATATRVLTSN